MGKVYVAIVALLVLVGAFFALNAYIYNEKQGDGNMQGYQNQNATNSSFKTEVTPIDHAWVMLKMAGKTIITDPVGADKYVGKPTPDIILITDIHQDHLDKAAIQALAKDNTTILVPKAVADQLANIVPGNMKVINNGQTMTEQGITVTAIAAYNLPGPSENFHVKGRGNGYLLEAEGERVYVAGDTADIPEMRTLQNIDIAFVPMNLPYTMDVEHAAEAVLAFKPKQVYPYHYRTPDGFSDVNKFKQLVNDKNADIEVKLVEWYR